MDLNTYNEIVKRNMPKVPKLRKAILAFFSGGFIGLGSEVVSQLLVKLFNISITNCYLIVGIGLVLITAILTGMGIFDDLVNIFEAGLIIPTTGFSHSVISSGMDGRREGFVVGLAPSMFKLCASVIISGVIASFILSIFGWIIYG